MVPNAKLEIIVSKINGLKKYLHESKNGAIVKEMFKNWKAISQHQNMVFMIMTI